MACRGTPSGQSSRKRVGLAALTLALLVLGVAPGVAEAFVYWGNYGNGQPRVEGASGATLGRANNDNTGSSTFVGGAGVNYPIGVAVNSSHIYWVNEGAPTAPVGRMSIGRANLNNTGVNPDFIIPSVRPTGVAVDGTYIYYTQVDGKIVRAPLDQSSGPQTIVSGLGVLWGVAVDSNYVYWAEPDQDRIGRIRRDLTGGQEDGWLTGLQEPRGVAVNGTHIFWSNSGFGFPNAGSIGRARLDGGDFTNAFVFPNGNLNTDRPCGVAVDSTYIYWANNGPGAGGGTTIGRATLAGDPVNANVSASIEKDFVQGAIAPCGVAVDGNFEAPLPGPSVSTLPASNVQQFSAQLNGTVRPNNAATTYHFEYGRDTNFGSRVPATEVPVGSGSSFVSVSQPLPEPDAFAETRYYYRIVATNADGVRTGLTQTFETARLPDPQNTSPPVVSGNAEIESTLTCSPGTWTDLQSANSLSYQWLRSGTAIPGQTGTTYKTTAQDADKIIQCGVTGEGFKNRRAFALSNRIAMPSLQQNIIVSGVEVTQGIQLNGCSGCIGSLPSRDQGNQTRRAKVRYQGLRMAQNKITYVRVFADYTRPRAGGPPLRNPNARLEVYDASGKHVWTALPASKPASLERVGGDGRIAVNGFRRVFPSASFNFALPAGLMRSNRFSFRAIVAPPNADPETPQNCTGCEGNIFDLEDVPFKETRRLEIKPVRFRINGSEPSASESEVFGTSQTLMPLDVDIAGYARSIAIEPAGTDDQKKAQVQSQLLIWAVQSNLLLHQPVGVYDRSTAGFGAATANEFYAYGGALPRAPIVSGGERQITSVMHELGHTVGRKHADAVCGGNSDGQRGEVLAPGNEEGRLNGFGFDPRGWNRGDPKSSPRVFANGLNGNYYDFMSYCGNIFNNVSETSADKPEHWIGPESWNHMLDLPLGGAIGARHKRGLTTRASAAGSRSLLAVATVDRSGAASISHVAPGDAQRLTPTPGTQFAVALLDASGKLLASTPATDAGTGEVLAATLPFNSAGRTLVLFRNGIPVALRARSANPPKVSFSSPRAGAKVGGKSTTVVSWKAGDADKNPLLASVDYSFDGGKTWQVVASNVRGNSTRIPSRYLSASKQGALRIRVNDGFDVGTETVRRLRAAGAPPRVRILSAPKGKIRADAPVILDGSAFDDRGNALKGKGLRWFAGKKSLGTGEEVHVHALPAGTKRLRLVAKDSSGRTREAVARVGLISVRPIFLEFKAPTRVKKSARSVKLRLASSLPAVFKIAGKRHSLDRKARTITVKVKPASKDLSVPYTLTSGGKTTRGTLKAKR